MFFEFVSRHQSWSWSFRSQRSHNHLIHNMSRWQIRDTIAGNIFSVRTWIYWQRKSLLCFVPFLAIIRNRRNIYFAVVLGRSAYRDLSNACCHLSKTVSRFFNRLLTLVILNLYYRLHSWSDHFACQSGQACPIVCILDCCPSNTCQWILNVLCLDTSHQNQVHCPNSLFKFCLIFAGYHPFDFIDILLLCSSTIENPLNVVQDWNLEWCWLWLCHCQQINIWPIWLVKFLNFGLAITIPNAVFSQRSLLWLNRFRRNLDTRMSKLVL